MKKTILHIMNYAASYRGNFIDSIQCLDTMMIHQKDIKNIYLFCKAAEINSASWITELKKNGEIIDFLSENTNNDSRLIKKIIMEQNVIGIHTHFISMKQYLAIYKATLDTKIPVIMHMHNHSTEATNPIKGFLRRKIYKNCYMIACSKSVYSSLERDYPRIRKTYVDNGVNFSRLDNYINIDDFEYRVDANAKKLLIFGFDFYRKGVDLAVKAVNELQGKDINYNLLISLSTNFDYVEDQIIRILGSMPDWIKIVKARNDVASLYNYVDLFLSPSREEGLPYSVVEAGYCECGIILSDIPAQKHLKLKYARFFRDEDYLDLAKEIRNSTALKNEKLVELETVKEYMKENYALEAWSNSIIKVYENVLGI